MARAQIVEAVKNAHKAVTSPGAKAMAREVRVTKADDGSGYITETHHNDPSRGEYTPPQKSIHTSTASIKRHIDTVFGGSK